MQLPKWKTISQIDPISIRCSVYATILIFAAAFTLALAFVTPLWLNSDTFPGQRFRRLGLWEACFDKLHDPYYRYDRVIQGCKWIFDEDYSFIIDFLEPSFFIATQVLFTAGYLLVVLVCAGILAVQQCFIIEREDYALRALSIATAISATSCTLAVTIFAINGTRKDWMPDPEHNYLSWSFAAAAVGTTLLWISSLLFYIDMRLMARRCK